MENKVTLGYWAIRGFGERIRHLLEYFGLGYDEIKYFGDVGGESRKKWFNEDKIELQKKNPAANLPYLLDGDKVICQSDAICVYICHKANRKDLLGRNADEQVTLYTALGVMKDLIPVFVKYIYKDYGVGTQQGAQQSHKIFMAQMDVFFKKLHGLLGNKQFMCGQNLVWLDFALAELYQSLSLLEPKLFQNYPNLITYQKRVWGLPQLQNYFSSDRYKQRPCHNTIAKWK